MSDLLDLVLRAHGGVGRWRQATTIRAKAVVGGVVWPLRRAKFPAEIATHSTEQTFYYDESGLLRRHDYRVEIMGASPRPSAHYTQAHRTVSGLVFPTHRYVVPTAEDNTAVASPIFITIDLGEITVP